MEKERPQEREKVLTLEKGKRGILKVIFGRTTIVMLLLLLNIVILFGIFNFLGRYLVYVFGGYVAFSLMVVIYIINQKGNPAFQLAWMVPVVFIPVFGALLYLYVDNQMDGRLVNRRMQQLAKADRKYLKQKPEVMEALSGQDEGDANLARYVSVYGAFPIYQNTAVTYFPTGEAKFEEMLVQLERAQHFIFMEYFIVEEGYMWGRVLEILQRKVQEGVEVRFMYDGMCSIALLPHDYPKKLQKLGIKSKMFAPIRPILSTTQNNRDHRKILVIDGHTAFTGGVNLADEYINRRVRFGHWKDTAVMLQGDAVQSFTLMFLQMWNISEKTPDVSKYIEMSVPVLHRPAPGFVMPYGDSPMDDENVGELVYMDIINRAKRYVHIMTPYLILDHEMITALTFAAKRGVDVVIIMPHIPDKKYAFYLAKTYYPELLAAGVRIYEYAPGFVHAKVFVSDDEKAVVGTINLDYRSLYLHYECAVYLYQVPAVADIERDVQDTLGKCIRITPEDCRREKLHVKLVGKVLRLFAPLM